MFVVFLHSCVYNDSANQMVSVLHVNNILVNFRILNTCSVVSGPDNSYIHYTTVMRINREERLHMQ